VFQCLVKRGAESYSLVNPCPWSVLPCIRRWHIPVGAFPDLHAKQGRSTNGAALLVLKAADNHTTNSRLARRR
jgi:hypothetical protein